MMNQDNPYAMNQTCKVCGEPAAGFHFGAFTCEGCKSFFGRSYNNLSSISDCKNNGECIINKKNRTACKACRLRKCLLVGMSKSGSRYGRRSNWFKIHCLLQEQQQQAAAAMAAAAQNQQHHHHHQQQQQQSGQHQSHLNSHHSPVGKSPLTATGLPNSAAAAAALGMLSHAGAYPGLYPPRTKEELMMLGLEEYAKHPVAASPCVSSPESHNSDSSAEINVRNNALLHLGKHPADTGAPPQLRKDALHPFLPLPFPGLSSMPVMPPPSFLPPSHLLFPGYHPALYQHHQGLLKPSPEQQQAAAAAAAVQQLFNSTNNSPARLTPNITAAMNSSPKINNDNEVVSSAGTKPECTTSLNSSNSSDELHTLNNNNNCNSSNHQQYLANGNKAAEELTKRFYLDAVLKSQRAASPPPSTTKLPARSTHDHSISALVTPNSDSGRERLASLQSPTLDNDDQEDGDLADKRHATEKLDSDCTEEEDVVVSMTPPSSPIARNDVVDATSDVTPPSIGRQQDNPIDLSLKTGSSISACSSISSKSSIASSPIPMQQRRVSKDSDSDDECGERVQCKTDDTENGLQRTKTKSVSGNDSAEDEDNSTVETVKTTILSNNNNHNNNNNNNNNNIDNNSLFCVKTNNNNNNTAQDEPIALNAKRKLEELAKFNLDFAASQRLDLKRIKVDCVATATPTKTVTTTPLDLTTKV